MTPLKSSCHDVDEEDYHYRDNAVRLEGMRDVVQYELQNKSMNF
jgi:hypothetical protein